MFLMLLVGIFMVLNNSSATIIKYPGAAAVHNGTITTQPTSYLQSYEAVIKDYPSFYYQKDCLAMYLEEVRKCSYGVTNKPKYVIALVGGSHSAHWFPALEPLAQQLEFQLDVYSHDGCRFTTEDPENHLTPQCLQWNSNLIEELKKAPPDLVFTTASLNKRDYVPQGYVEQWRKLEGLTTIFAILDTPRMEQSIPSCLKQHTIEQCSVKRQHALSSEVPWENEKNLPSNVIFADLSDYFCSDTVCPPVIGEIIVYRDQHHVTASYAKTLAPILSPHIEAALAHINE